MVRSWMGGDKAMARAEVADRVAKLFAKLDANHDGFVTKDEVEALHQRMLDEMDKAGDVQKRLAEHGALMGDRGAMFDRLDINHDGNISRAEFMSGKPQVRKKRVMIMCNGAPGMAGDPGLSGMQARGIRMHGKGMGGFGGHLFETADANHDGLVSLAEAQSAALAHFDNADLNHDGDIRPDGRSFTRKCASNATRAEAFSSGRHDGLGACVGPFFMDGASPLVRRDY